MSMQIIVMIGCAIVNENSSQSYFYLRKQIYGILEIEIQLVRRPIIIGELLNITFI